MKRVKIINTDGVSMGTKIIDADTGAEIKNVAEAHVHFEVNEPVKADLVLNMVEADVVAAEAVFFLRSVENGVVRKKRVKSVTFADGTVVDY